MPTIFNTSQLYLQKDETNIPKFNLLTAIPRLSKVADSKHLIFDLRSLEPCIYSFPYHFHKNAEELIILLSGSMTLRTPDGLQTLNQGDIVFFEIGDSGTHQFYNHDNIPCTYLDIKTNIGFDVCEYPDSEKIYITPEDAIYEKKDQVDYFKGEENVDEKWESLK